MYVLHGERMYIIPHNKFIPPLPTPVKLIPDASLILASYIFSTNIEILKANNATVTHYMQNTNTNNHLEVFFCFISITTICTDTS